jgi:ATP-binding cassette subfamily B protein
LANAVDATIDSSASDVIITLTLIYLGLSILVWMFQSANVWFTSILSSRFIDNIRKKAFEKLIDADMSYHHKQQSGNITSRVINDSQEVATGLTVFTSTSSQFLLVFATLIVLGGINPYFILIALLAVPAAMLITKFIGTIGKKKMLQVRQAYGKVSGQLAENLAGITIAKSFNQEARTSKVIRKLNYETYGYMKQLGVIFMLVFPSISFIATILTVLVLIVGGVLSQNDPLMTIGQIYLATVLVTRFLMPIIQLANNFTQLQASLAALDRIVDVIEAEPGIKDSENAQPLKLTRSEIIFNDVSFAYVKGEPVLKNVSFTIPSGQKTAIVGHTGAGKTTITNLIMRFYDPMNGTILVDEQDLKQVTLETLYDQVSYVSQDPYLFAGTVIDNIRYGKPSASDDEIYRICELIGADQFIDALPQGYHTSLQESGKSLSAGQRQMITIVRTMLSDPKILILDEATSRLDALTESLVQKAQLMLFEGRTTLIIAHRLSTIRDVEQIIVVDDGELIEKGNHDELYRMKGKYHELYETYYSHQGIETLAD